MVGKIEEFQPGDDIEAYVDRLKMFFKVNGTKEEDKTPLFITVMGTSTYKILKSLMVPEDPTIKVFEDLAMKLISHLTPRVNKRSERYKFYRTVQEVGETITDFVVRLKALATSCKFGDFLDKKLEDTTLAEIEYGKVIPRFKNLAIDEALSDRLIVGLRNENIQQALLNEDGLNFEQYFVKALNMEMSERETKNMQPAAQFTVQEKQNENISKVKTINQQGRKTYRNRGRSPSWNRHFNVKKLQHSLCRKCGGRHKEENCHAVQCFICKKYGHISKSCYFRGRRIQYIQNVSIGSVEPASIWLSVEGHQLEMEIDTGACSSIISEGQYTDLFKHCEIYSVSKNFVSVSGTIDTIGKINVKVEFNDKVVVLEFIVIKSERKFRPLLGRSWLEVLYPDWRKIFLNFKENPIHQVVNTKYLELIKDIKLKFKNIISEQPICPIEGFVAEIVMRDNAHPIFHKAYTVPFKLQSKLEDELNRLVGDGVLIPVRYSRWASPIVIVPKANGELRICIDCKVTINKFIETEHYPLPKIEDIFANLSNCSYFCVIDLAGAYQQLRISENSKEYLVVNTHKGLFQYTRLPFGVSSAPSIFQSVMDQILTNIEKVFCYLDDIIIGGISIEECRNKLYQVLERLNYHNVKINLSKSKFLETSVQYLGHIISSAGLSPNKEKLKAVAEAPSPKNEKQLQSFLGLINYYGRFIPNLSSELSSLYKLLRKDIPFEWNLEQETSFQRSKSLILQNNVLELYDPLKPIIIATDASPYGVGAVLSHIVKGEEKPVMFVSSSLSNAEKNYSQLHREALAIIFALRKFHKYIYGHRFVIYCDNQALKEIFQPKKGNSAVATFRLQRWSVILSMYDYQIKFRSSTKMSNVDALSRLPLEEKTEEEYCGLNYLNFSNEFPLTISDIKDKMEVDEILNQVYGYVKNGWTEVITDEIRPYYLKRISLSTDNGCLYYGDRIVIPNSLKEKVLNLLHENHIGIIKMKVMARSYFWWIRMNEDIENFVKQCNVCEKTQNVKREVVVSTWTETEYPFQRIHLDFFFFGKYTFMIIIDHYSRYLEVKLINRTNASNVIEKLCIFFSIFGLPKEIVSDNGPPFNSFQFAQFSKKHGIALLKSPPYHPQSNGLAERHVQTVKRCLKKHLIENRGLEIQKQIDKFLLQQRNIPNAIKSKTPSEIVFTFKPRTLLDLTTEKKVQFNVPKKLTVVEFKKVPGRVDNDGIEFKINEKVMYRNHFKTYIRWIPARVVKRISKFTYLIALNHNIRVVHVNQIRKSKLSDKYHPIIDPLPTFIPESLPNQNYRKQNGKRKHSDSDIKLRRSKRIRWQPNRLNYE